MLLQRRRARASLASFGTFVGNAMSQEGWNPYPFHHDLASKLEAVERGDLQRLLVMIPPQHGKSSLVAQLLPAWALGRNPGMHIIMGSYSATMIENNSRLCRSIVNSVEYRELFPECRISMPDTVREWGTTNGGHMLAVGRGGSATGHGANLLVVDDPYANMEEADSTTIREKTWDWFNAVIRTRSRKNAPIVVLHTRWHEDDLIGRLQKEGGWDSVVYPAIREDGTALWPEQHSIEKLEDLRRRLGSRVFSALYMQTPMPDGGGIFKRQTFRYYTQAGTTLTDLATGLQHDSHAWRRFATMDIAVTTKASSDWTVLGIWAQSPDKKLWLIDLVRDRMETPALLDLIASARHRYGVPTIYIESNGVGLPIFQSAQARKLPVLPVEQHKDKVSRAQACTPWFERGDVMFPRDAPWLSTFESELLSFPAAAHDDQCFPAWVKVWTARGNVAIYDVVRGDLVMTRHGWREVIAAGRTGDSEVITRFGITATPGHRVWTENKSWITLDSLSIGDTLLRWNEHSQTTETSSCSMDAGTSGIHCPPASTSGATTGGITRLRGVLSRFIETCGLFTTEGLSPLGASSTIKTGILSTMTPAILNALLKSSIGLNTTMPSWPTRIQTSSATISRNFALSAPHPFFDALFAALSTSDTPAGGISFARGARLPPNEPMWLNTMRRRKLPVYNLQVDGTNEFFADGVLVHNCDCLSTAIALADQSIAVYDAPGAFLPGRHQRAGAMLNEPPRGAKRDISFRQPSTAAGPIRRGSVLR